MLSNRVLGVNVNKCLDVGVIVPMALYGLRLFVKTRECVRVEVRNLLAGLTRMDRVRNEEVRSRTGIERERDR